MNGRDTVRQLLFAADSDGQPHIWLRPIDSVAARPLTGTLAYIAPEMVTSALAADPRSDIYSLGVTLYEMLTGRRPWNSDDPGELATLHREAKPPQLNTVRPDVPRTIADLVQEMLAKDALRRPANPRELASRLVKLEIESFSLR